jgi:hypothetical protein
MDHVTSGEYQEYYKVMYKWFNILII